MRLPSFVSTAIASAVLLCAAGAAQADITTYTSQAAYLAAVGNTGVDSFDDLDLDEYIGPLDRAAGDYDYTVSGGDNSDALWGATDDFSDFWLTGGHRLDVITFNLNNVNGAGGFFFGSDLFGSSTQADYLILTATDSTGATITYTLPTPELDSFVGFVSDANLVSLTMAAEDQPGVWATVNDLHLSTVSAVPEPSTYGMMLGGLGLLGYLARRKARKA